MCNVYIAFVLIKVRFIGVLLGAMLFGFSQGQEWNQLVNQDFVYYFKPDNRKNVAPVDSVLSSQLKNVQRTLNYYASNPIDIFIVDKDVEMATVNVKKQPGSVSLLSGQIVINVHASTHAIASLFRKECSKILVEEMMYGGTFQDKVKTNNLISLPEWLIPGLQHYLAYDWSAETDNTMRYIHDQYGLTDFDAIPSIYNDVKGASFWKFVAYKYGPNAIPTVLYMARVTRKFNASVYYSFQVSAKELFEDWQEFYDYGYSQDQKKPNPVNGIMLSVPHILDIYVASIDTYYTLEENFWGIHWFEHKLQTASKQKIMTLSRGVKPLPQFSGGIFKGKNGVCLIVNAAKHAVLYTQTKSGVTKRKLDIPQVNGVGGGDGVFLIESQLSQSYVYALKKEGTPRVLALKGYVNSIGRWDGVYYYIREEGQQNYIVSRSDDKEDILLASNTRMRQLLYAGDATLLYNADENGIWNGKILYTNQRKSKTLTNYRSNIIFHQFTPEVFVEFLDRGINSSLSITDHIKSTEFYSYTDITPAYFSDLEVPVLAKEETKQNFNQDSLKSYTFQNEVYPSTDFTISNYDSLVDAKSAAAETFLTPSLAVDYYSPSLFTLALVNQPEKAAYSIFENSYRTLLPSHLNIKAGIAYTNQFNTKRIQAYYLGAMQVGARDISLKYLSTKKLKYSFDVMSRQRITNDELGKYRYLTNMGEFTTYHHFHFHGDVMQYLRFWQALEVPLAVNSETLFKKRSSNYLAAYSLHYTFKNETPRNQLAVDVKVTPMLELSQSKKSVTAQITSNHKWSLGQFTQWINKSEAGISLGPNPVVFLLGGNATDFLNVDKQREFSADKAPIMYQNVFGIRGFQSNYRNGTTYAMHSSEIQFKLATWLRRKPVTSELFSHLSTNFFVDMGLSYYGQSIYDPANILNTRYIVSSTGAVTTKVIAFKNPFIISSGVGVSTQIYGYKVNFAYALGLEDQVLQLGVFHLSVGTTF